MITKELFKEIRTTLKLSQEEFGKKISLSTSMIGFIERGEKPISDGTEAKIKLLIQDKGYKIYNSNLVKEEDSYQVARQKMKINGDKSTNSAPLVPVKAQAGYTRSYDQTDYIDTLERFALPPGITRHGAIWRYWEIEGESMEPTFYSKDIILTSQVHPMDWNDLRNFYTYVIVMSGSVYIKRVYRKTDDEWVLISDNEDNGYEQFAINPKDIKEVWVFRRHIDSKAPAPKQFKIKI